MATSLRNVTVAPKGMGLNDFVAQQEGYFAAEGLDVELDWKTFRGTQSSWKGLAYFERPQDRGERFVHRPIPRQEFDEVLEQVTRWGLDDFLKDRSFDALSYAASR
jgi:hypothetical protein